MASRFTALTFLVLLICGFDNPIPEQHVRCGKVKIDFDLSKESNTELSELSIRPSGGKAPYYIVLLDENRKLVSKDFDKSRFENLKPGTYRCLVSDSEDCSAELEIKVQ